MFRCVAKITEEPSRISVKKSYSLLEPFSKDREVKKLAKAMSTAVDFSKERVADICKAVKANG